MPQPRTLSKLVGDLPAAPCRAWVNFNGGGTIAIRASFNVSSITDLGVAYYRTNFATAMPDENYSALAFGTSEVNGQHTVFFHAGGNASYFDHFSFNVTNSNLRADKGIVCVAVFR